MRPGSVFCLLQGLGAVAAVELEAGDGRVVAHEVLRDAPVASHHLISPIIIMTTDPKI